jgi:ribonuclease HI
MPAFSLYFDGAAKGNPGPAGAGAVIYSDTGAEIWSRAYYVGRRETNNVAEYTGLIIGLEELVSRGITDCAVYGDSNLVIQQMLGKFKVSSPALAPLYKRARELAAHIPNITYAHVYRNMNARADALSNEGVAHGK